MPLPIDDLIRKATTVTTNLTKLIPQIWAAQLEVNLRKQAVIQSSIITNTDLLVPGAGDTVYIPILPDLTLADLLTEGTDMVPYALTNAVSVPLIPVEYGKVVEITRKALDRIKYDGMAAIMDRLAYAMTLRIEGNIFALGTATVPVIGGGLPQLYPNGHATGTIVATDTFSDALLLQGKQILQQNNNVPFEDGFYRIFVTPAQANQLFQDTNVRNDLRWGQPERLFSGELGVLHGIRIIVTNYAVVTTENTFNVGQAIMCAPRWAAIAYKRRAEAYVDPTLYDGGRRRRFGIIADFDAELIHAERAIVIHTFDH